MRRLLVVVAVLAVGSGLAFGQTQGTSGMINSGHDLSAGSSNTWASTDALEICVFCHTPHQATAASSQDPLWNHTLSTVANYGVYASDTLNATVTDIGGAAIGSQSASNLCMSCHDGTVGLGSLYNDPNATGAPSNAASILTGNSLLGTDLSNDHPINFTYNEALATADGGLYVPDSTTSVDAGGVVPLFGGTVQCASCHDPHDTTNAPFLVKNNTDSALCAECHTK